MTTDQVARFVLVFYLLVFLLLQLFTFERFPNLLGGIGIMGTWGTVVAISLVTLELLALPYLLSMNRLPKFVKNLSATSVFIALGVLSVLEVLGYMSGQTVMFGATFEMQSGSWSILLMVALWILAFWGVFGRRWGLVSQQR